MAFRYIHTLYTKSINCHALIEQSALYRSKFIKLIEPTHEISENIKRCNFREIASGDDINNVI